VEVHPLAVRAYEIEEGLEVRQVLDCFKSARAAQLTPLALTCPRDARWRSIHENGTPFPSDKYPVMVTLRTGQPCFDVVMGVHRPTGELTWVSINSQPLIRPGEQGTITTRP
jgi:hypothetical protein